MARSTAIDRLRGWAFLMVFCGHVFMANLGGGAWLLVFDPVYGVSLFFSISGALVGLTLLASSRPHAIINSTVRRVIRLSLPHAVALLAYAAIGQARLFESLDLPASPADGVGDLLISGSLLFGALPTTGGVNLVVPGNWSISAELLAALVLLPLLARLCRDERSAFWVFIVGSVAGGVLASVLRQTSSNLIFWAPLHIGAFAGGWWALLRSRRSDPL